jgi:hypothetical protein
MPMRVHLSLEAWRAAERERDATQSGTAERAAAEARVLEAKEAYLEAVRELADRAGSSAMPDPLGAPKAGE